MKVWLGTLVLLITFLLPQTSRAILIFSDNFDTETLALNYTGFSQWTVSDGTVDLIGQGGGFDFLPGNGRYVDLDGSSGNAGIMRSSSLSLTAGVEYTLTISLAGSQRGDLNVVRFGLDLNSDDVFDVFGDSGQPSDVDFNVQTITFTPGSSTGSARILVSNSGGDNLGALLDNVALNSRAVGVPEPSSLLLLGAGIAGLAAWRRRQSQ